MNAKITREKTGNIKLVLNNVDEKQRNRIWNQIHFNGKLMNVYPFHDTEKTEMEVEFWVSSLTPEKNLLAIKVICQEIGAKITEVIDV
jgi:hypothetical protein